VKPPYSSGEQQAQARFGTAKRAAAFDANQRLDHLNPAMRAFIARQDMVWIATADACGRCDCSFRAGEAGFVEAIDAKTLIYPEYRGNGVFASVGNILENPHIGLIFLDCCRTTIGLHVNGRARVMDPGETIGRANAALGNGARRPEMWVRVEVEEAYLHCSKHVPLMKKLDKPILSGTADDSAKNGDFFQIHPGPQAP
jgi:predicted pyridoxine 5'-phosphate oxidase superfamily flavin-nucleotide-binding protein